MRMSGSTPVRGMFIYFIIYFPGGQKGMGEEMILFDFHYHSLQLHQNA